MNLLAIDAGNSRIKWGMANTQGWLRHGVLDTIAAAQLAQALSDLPEPERVVVSNVAGAATREALTQALTRYAAAPQWVQGMAAQCGVRSRYAAPTQLGSDRWAGLIAAWKRYGSACIVANAGTTMTVDALSHEGVFLGGVIVPGLDLMCNALASGTAQLKRQPGAFAYFPDNTANAIMSGAINALTGTIERMHGHLAQSAGAGSTGVPLVVLSGGTATQIAPQLNLRCERVDNLVLEGLREIAEVQC